MKMQEEDERGGKGPAEVVVSEAAMADDMITALSNEICKIYSPILKAMAEMELLCNLQCGTRRER